MAPPPTLTAAERTRLVRILGMLGSAFEGERKAAVLAATRFLKERWCSNFVNSISRRPKGLTPGQAAKLAEIAGELGGQGFA